MAEFGVQSQNDQLPVTALLPASVLEPVVIYDDVTALRLAVVERQGAVRLSPDQWDRPGVYVLLDLPEPSGSYGCYVGQAVSPGVRSRLLSHVHNKDHWSRALLVVKDTSFGFNSAQVGWLEGRLHGVLDSAELAWLHNHDRPRDETLPPYERQALETSVMSISRVLRLLGYNPESPGDEGKQHPPEAAGKAYRGQVYYGIKLLDLIDAGLMQVDTTLLSTNSAYPATATVRRNGLIETDGGFYETPSAAASAVRGGAANGWDFWAADVDGRKVPLADLRRELIALRRSGGAPDSEPPTVSSPIQGWKD